MSDFLSNLVARTIAQPALRPRTRSRFEAPAIEEAPLIWPEATREAEPRETARAAPAVRASTPVRVAGPAEREARSLPSGETPLGQPAGRRRSTEADRPSAAAIEEAARVVAAASEIERVVETKERVIHVPAAARPHRFDEQPPRVIERRGPREIEEVQRERVINTTTERTRRAMERPRHSVAAAPAAEPVIQVSIGRIEVRAVPSAPPARNAPRGGTMTIDDYVAKRKAKERR